MDELVLDAQLGGGGFKESGQISVVVGKTVGELKTISRLDALHPDAPMSVPLVQTFQEIVRGIGALLRVSSKEAQMGELVNDGVQEQAQFGSVIHLRGTTFTSTRIHCPG